MTATSLSCTQADAVFPASQIAVNAACLTLWFRARRSPRLAPAAAAAARTPSTSVAQKSELTLLCERFQQQFGHLQVRFGSTGQRID